MPFGITPLAGFAQQAPTEFPRFLQWQQDGTDLGDNTVQVVNITTGLTATRGTGENINTVSVAAIAPPDQSIQFQNEGVDLGTPTVDTLNFTGLTTASRVGNTVTVEGVEIPPFVWNDQAGDYRLQASDAENGVATTGTTGTQAITIPDDVELDVPVGTSILFEQDGAAPMTFNPVSGVTLHVRSAFVALSAGQYAILTLIKRAANTWVLCGDMEQA
jgi:hypothetical protein